MYKILRYIILSPILLIVIVTIYTTMLCAVVINLYNTSFLAYRRALASDIRTLRRVLRIILKE